MSLILLLYWPEQFDILEVLDPNIGELIPENSKITISRLYTTSEMKITEIIEGIWRLITGYRMKNWEKILKILYEREDDWEYFSDGDTGIVSDHPLVEKSGIPTSKTKAGISFLQEHDLVYQTPDGTYRLTSEGFEVARKQEMRRTQAFQNRVIVFLTIVIAFTSVLEHVL